MNPFRFKILAIDDSNVTVEPAIKIVINQLFREAASNPEPKSIDTSICINIEDRLLAGWVVPCQALWSLHRLPSIRPCVLASD